MEVFTFKRVQNQAAPSPAFPPGPFLGVREEANKQTPCMQYHLHSMFYCTPLLSEPLLH